MKLRQTRLPEFGIQDPAETATMTAVPLKRRTYCQTRIDNFYAEEAEVMNDGGKEMAKIHESIKYMHPCPAQTFMIKYASDIKPAYTTRYFESNENKSAPDIENAIICAAMKIATNAFDVEWESEWKFDEYESIEDFIEELREHYYYDSAPEDCFFQEVFNVIFEWQDEYFEKIEFNRKVGLGTQKPSP